LHRLAFQEGAYYIQNVRITDKKEIFMSTNNSSGKGLLIGLLAGGIVGAAIALLYAPKSGRELRKDIKDKTDDYIGEADRYIADAKHKAKDLINEGKKRSDKLIQDAKSRSEILLKDAEKIFSDARSKTNNVVASTRETLEAEGTHLKSALKAGVDAYKETKKS
jgi:gas vesicle protein